MTPSAKMNLLLLALLISLGLNIYEITLLNKCNSICEKEDKEDKTKKDPEPVPGTAGWTFCNNEGRFDPNDLHRGGEEKDTKWAETLVMNYRASHKEQITGFLFSKKVFDHIFNSSNTKTNMVRFDLVILDKPYLIAKGVSTSFSEITLNGKNDRVFINQSMCPADCNMNLYD